MNLTLFFRLIVMSIFQRNNADYDRVYFYCPRVYAKDGFNISLQINNANYCSSENGYRNIGHTWKTVEFGFPSHNEKLLWKYSEMWGYEESNDDQLLLESNESIFGLSKSKMDKLIELYTTSDKVKFHKIVSKYKGKSTEITEYVIQIVNARNKEKKQFDVTDTVGSIPIEVLEQVFEKHGGIDWEKTISIDRYNKYIGN